MTDKAPFLFAIRAEYVARILDGSKRWEFRKSMPRFSMGDLALIYESRGRGRVVASFRVGSLIFEMSPGTLWETIESMDPGSHGIDCLSLSHYLDRVYGVAFGITDVRPLDLPLPANMRPPQRWVRWRGEKVSP